jgi:hypothetical protein
MFVCALTVFSTCGTENMRTRKPLHNWALFRNVHNRRRALQLLHDLNQQKTFLGANETVEHFFMVYNYGSAAMTMRHSANTYGFWADGATMSGTVVTGVHVDIKFHLDRCGYHWAKEP